MNVTLLRADDGSVILEALRVCKDKVVTVDTIRKIIKNGEESPLEHIVYSFKVDGISRVCLAQLTRHRMASYSVSSQRSIDQSDAEFYVPENLPKAIKTHMEKHYEKCAMSYHWLIKHGVKQEDARFVLPEATLVNVVMTINLRSLRNFLKLRLDSHAQTEIRELANKICDLIPAMYVEDIRPTLPISVGSVGDVLTTTLKWSRPDCEKNPFPGSWDGGMFNAPDVQE